MGLLAIILVFAGCVYFIGRMPIGGRIIVSQAHSHRLSKLLKDNHVYIWQGFGSTGMFSVQFKNPLTFNAIERQVIEDAELENYDVIIKYRCLISYFDHERRFEVKD